MQRQEKEARVEELAEQLKGKGVILLSDFTGMDVATATEIRRQFREVSVEYRVVKNTLARLAAKQAGYEELVSHLEGPNAVVLTDGDPAAAAKILAEFEKKNKTPQIRMGLIDSNIVTAGQIRQIATLPGREVLLAQIAAGIQAPVSCFARTLGELLRRLVSTLDEVGKTKGEAGA